MLVAFSICFQDFTALFENFEFFLKVFNFLLIFLSYNFC